MVTEDYVSFEIAKLLKEKGFDESTSCQYPVGGIHSGEVGEYNITDRSRNPKDYIPAPTLQMTMKWLQEAFNIIIIPDYEYECTSTPWCYKIFKLGKNGKPERVAVRGVSYDKDNNQTEHIVCYRDYESSYKDYSTKEEAVEEGIKYCLENLI